MPGEDQEVFLEHPVADVLAALPPTGTLEVFRTRFWENLDVDDLDDLKEMLSLPALRGLRTLYLTDTALLGYGLDDVDEEGEFEEWCKERGIEVFVSEIPEVSSLLRSTIPADCACRRIAQGMVASTIMIRGPSE